MGVFVTGEKDVLSSRLFVSGGGTFVLSFMGVGHAFTYMTGEAFGGLVGWSGRREGELIRSIFQVRTSELRYALLLSQQRVKEAQALFEEGLRRSRNYRLSTLQAKDFQEARDLSQGE